MKTRVFAISNYDDGLFRNAATNAEELFNLLAGPLSSEEAEIVMEDGVRLSFTHDNIELAIDMDCQFEVSDEENSYTVTELILPYSLICQQN